jgi:hypothetical protein
MQVLVPLDGSEASFKSLGTAFEADPTHVTALTCHRPDRPELHRR